MKYDPINNHYIQSWVDIRRLESLWPKDDFYVTTEDLKRIGIPPSPSWFTYDGTERIESFILPRASLSIRHDTEDPYLTFENGRHRTRWLINTANDLGVNTLPMNISVDTYERATKYGLTAYRISQHPNNQYWEDVFRSVFGFGTTKLLNKTIRTHNRSG